MAMTQSAEGLSGWIFVFCAACRLNHLRSRGFGIVGGQPGGSCGALCRFLARVNLLSVTTRVILADFVSICYVRPFVRCPRSRKALGVEKEDGGAPPRP